MKKFLLGKKVGMTQIITEDGEVIPVTVVKAGPCNVLSIKTEADDGYNAIQVGYEAVKAEKLTKPVRGYFEKNGLEACKHVQEFRVDQTEGYELKQVIDVTVFAEGDKVNVRGKTIGRGHAGTIKRHNFRRGPMSHGSKSHRITGSIGGGTYPGRVIKGKKMSGHYGDEYITVKNLEVVGVDQEDGLLLIKGAIPGKKSLVEIVG